MVGSRWDIFENHYVRHAAIGIPAFGMEYSIGVLHLEEAKLVTKTAGTERSLLHHDGDVAPHKNWGYLSP